MPRARASPTPSTARRSSIVAASSFWQAAEVLDQPVDDPRGQPRHPGEQPEAARADGGVERVGRGGQAVAAGDGGEVEQFGGRQGAQVGEHLVDRPGRPATRRQVVADQQAAVLLDAGEHLVELQRQQAAVGAELDDESLDLVGDPPDHLQPLADAHRVADRDEVLDLQRRQRAGDLVEAQLVALEGGQRLVGPGEDRRRVLEGVPPARRRRR